MKIRRRHINDDKFWGFMTSMAILPPWLWFIAMSLARVLTGLAERRVMMSMSPIEEVAP